ncbi:MAG: M28 family peptidase [Promethearchaeota archaeon]
MYILFNSIIFIFLFFSSSFIILSNSPHINNIVVELNFNEAYAYQYIQDQLDLNTTHYRIPGTKGREDCAQYFITKFQEIDASFTYILHNFTIQSVDCQNLLFKLNENKKNIVILGAHYDSRAKATKDPDIMKRSDPIPGANDGASGCAVLIELASVLYQNRNNLECQVWFLFFDAEDQGEDSGGYGIDGWDWCEGSEKFTQDIQDFYNSNEEQIDGMILLDMVGGMNLQFIAEQYSTSSLLDELFDVGRFLGYNTEFPSFRTSNLVFDDHYHFIALGIPSADLIINFWNNPGWPYHHTVKDDITTLSIHSLEVTGKTVEQFIYNNYLIGANNDYQGRYPWNFDLNALDSEIMTILTIICISICVIFTFQYIYRQKESKKTFELPK